MQGYIARDDLAKRIIISLRGTQSFPNVLVDAMAFMSPTGVIANCTSCRIHSGFYMAWQAVERTIKRAFQAQLRAFPDYQVLITGHSLGAAVAALLGLSYEMRGEDPVVITFGQPRVGNPAFAEHINTVLVDKGKLIRVTHGNDPVVHVPWQAWGFKHHGVLDPS